MHFVSDAKLARRCTCWNRLTLHRLVSAVRGRWRPERGGDVRLRRARSRASV